MNKSISLLLGAGFSAPMGYPVGSQLKDKLLSLNHNNFEVESGMLHPKENNQVPSNHKPEDFIYFFCIDMINHFKQQRGDFNYEEFYDYLIEEAKTDKALKTLAQPYSSIFGKDSLIDQSLKIYNQLVAYFIKDGSGRSHYEDVSYSESLPTHMGILRCINEFCDQGNVNVHTLNHDLLFERFSKTNALFEKISDGFEEVGSPYYGRLSDDSDGYSVRLERYTGKYSSPCRLYKLHGSLDYYCHPIKKSGTMYALDCYIKCKAKVDMNSLKKEIEDNSGTKSYEKIPPSYYHPDFLTGTTAKILRYAEPLLYKKLFEHFQKNLKQAEKLIIIGYGGGDEKVNEVIITHFDYHNKPIYIIDPKANDTLQKLKGTSALDAKLISKKLKEITIEDFVSSEQI